VVSAVTKESAIVFSGIAPHPPIMVPEVGRESIAEVRSSVAAMAEFTNRIIASGAETVVLVSPHAPLDPTAFVAYCSPKLYGDFTNFRAPAARFEFPLDQEMLDAITTFAAADDYEVMKLESSVLDHGSAVPLYFLDRNGWHGSVVVLGYTFLGNDDHLIFGKCIRLAAEAVGRPLAFIASGDLSHRLKPDAPAGFEPYAYLFDDEVVSAVHDNLPDRIVNIDQDLRRTAGECGYRSMLVALGATHALQPACEVLSYEAPFGVGYLVAQLTNKRASAIAPKVSDSASVGDDASVDLPALARLAVETFVISGTQIAVPAGAGALLSARAACFVSIKTDKDELRGCVGTIEPVKENLADELIANAISAATRDPRFSSVSAIELGSLRYSVDILAVPEPAVFEDLDPKVYGLIVEDSSGRRGLLLPDIPGVETASQQLEIAARKAGIPTGPSLKLSRFRVDRFRE
jgi:AmmeMemoRadiSam system protein A